MDESEPAPSWVALLTLMVHGPAIEPTRRGTIRSVDGSDEQRGSLGWTAFAGDPLPVLAGAAADGDERPGETRRRVWCDGVKLRIEGLNGQVNIIADAETVWQFDREHEAPVASPRRALRYWGNGTNLLQRREAAEFAGDDFTRPTGAVGATSFLDRPAWTVELAPPSHQPHPLQLVVDAETGLVLQQRNDGFGSVDEWIELAVGEPLDAALFRWDGPTRDYRDEQPDYEAEHAALVARGQSWFAANVIGEPIRAEFTLDVAFVHEYDETTGAFQASLGADQIGLLARRPHSTQPWDLRWGEIQYRRSSSRWDWALTFHRDLPTPESVEELLHRLDPEATS